MRGRPFTGFFGRKQYGERSFFEKNKFSAGGMVVHPLRRNNHSLYSRSYPLEVTMIRYFLRYKPGWWVLHVLVIGLTFYLGHLVTFHF